MILTLLLLSDISTNYVLHINTIGNIELRRKRVTKKAEPGPEDDDPPEGDKGKQSGGVDPGPEDDDPPPEKRSRVSFLLRWWYMLVRLFRRS